MSTRKKAKSKADTLGESLSPETRRVLRLLLLGKSNPEMARQLRCSTKNIEYHVSKILRKARTPSRTRLLAKLLTPIL